MDNTVSLDKQLALEVASNQGWFIGLNDDEVARLVSRSQVKAYNAGELVYIPGQKQENLYCIIDGLVKISLVNKDGDQFPLIILEAGSWFGESALYEESVMPVETSAKTQTKVLVVPISEIDDALDNNAKFYKNILQETIARTHLLFRLVDMLVFKTLQARLAARILHLISLFGEPCPEGIKLPLEFSQSDFARMSGGSRQRVNKIFGGWYSSGVMTKQEKWYVVHDIQALESELA